MVGTQGEEQLPDVVDLDESVDTHVHTRDHLKRGDGRMNVIVPLVAKEHGVIVAIGNSRPPVLDILSARQWKEDIQSCIPEGNDLRVLIAALVTDRTPPGLIQSVWGPSEDPPIHVLKIFYGGVSNDGGKSVSDNRHIEDVIRATYRKVTYRKKNRPMPIMIHAERKHDRQGRRLEMRDREWYCIEHDVDPLLRNHPEAQITIAHVTDERTVEWIRERRHTGYNVYGEIATHYLVLCHEDLYEARDGVGTAFQANNLCWPIYKNDASMRALQQAALNPEDCFHSGSDFACHIDDPTQAGGVKITNEGEVCGGVAITPALGKSLLINFFLKHGKIDSLNAFISGNARAKLYLPPSSRKIRYERRSWPIKVIEGQGPRGPFLIQTFMRGQIGHWRQAV